MAATKNDIIASLRQAYNMEVETVINYLANSLQLEGVRAEFIKQALATDIQEELGHAQQLGNRPAAELAMCCYLVSKPQKTRMVSLLKVAMQNLNRRFSTILVMAFENGTIAACPEFFSQCPLTHSLWSH